MKAGLFAGEVTQSAPAGGAATDKANGYQWMEYGLAPPAQSRVLAWWEFEESSGESQTKLYDEVQAYEFASNNAYNSVAGVRGQGAFISATGSQNIDNGAVAELTLVDQVYSISFWYMTPAVGLMQAGKYVACSWRAADVSLAPPRRKYRVMYNAGANGFIYSIGNGPGYTDIVDVDTGDINLQADTWYHFALTHDPVADEMSFTVSERGGSVGTRLTESIVGGAWVGGPPPILELPHYLGRDLAGLTSTFADGVIDMYAVWNTDSILTETEVAQLFTQELKYSELQT